MPPRNPAASSKAFDAFLRMFRNHRAEGIDVPLETYISHYKAAESWIRASWDDLDAAHPSAKSSLTPVSIPSVAPVIANPVVAPPRPALSLPAPQKRSRSWWWVVAGCAVVTAAGAMAYPFGLGPPPTNPTPPTPNSDATREQAAVLARNVELEAATRRSGTERDNARSERDDAVATLDQTRRELSHTKDSLIVSEGRRLLIESRRRSKSDPTLGLLIAIEGAQRAPGPIADAALREALTMLRERQSVVAAPTGTYAMSWRLDQRAIVASAATGGTLWTPDGTSWKRHTLEGPTTGFQTAAWSLDGTRFALGGADGVARVFDATGQLVLDLKDHPCDVTSIALSPNGALALTGGSDGTARIFEVPSGKLIRNLELMDPIDAVTFDRRGIHIAVITRGDHRTRFFAVATGRPEGSILGELVGGPEGFSPDGDRVLIRAHGGSLAYVRWFGSEGLVNEPLLNGTQATAGAISSDGSLLVVVDNDRFVRILDAESKAVRAAFMGPPTAPTTVAFTADNLGLLFASRDGVARHWSIRPVLDSGRLAPLDGLRDVVGLKDPIALTVDGTQLNLAPLRLAGTPQRIQLPLPPSSVALSGDGSMLVTADKSGVTWFDASQGSQTSFVPHPNPGPFTLVASTTGQHVALVTSAGRVFLSTHRGEFKDAGWDGPVDAIAMDPAGSHVVIGSRDRPATVMDIASNRRLATLGGTMRGVTSLATRGQITAAATSDGIVSIHETSTGRTLGTTETQGDVKYLAIDAAGATLAVVTASSTWFLVDVATGEKRLEALTGVPNARPLFLLDGTAALIGSDGTCLRLNVDPLTEAMARKPRSLSVAERARLGIPAAAR